MVLAVCFLTLGLMWTGMSAKHVARPCDQYMFHSNVDSCLSVFNNSMETSGYQYRCPWPMVKGIYNNLEKCVSYSAEESSCKVHRSLEDEVYLEVHLTYFSLCGLIRDPPLVILAMLVSPPIVFTLLVPFLCVYLNTEDHNISLWSHGLS